MKRTTKKDPWDAFFKGIGEAVFMLSTISLLLFCGGLVVGFGMKMALGL